jgi:hypothetical protein
MAKNFVSKLERQFQEVAGHIGMACVVRTQLEKRWLPPKQPTTRLTTDEVEPAAPSKSLLLTVILAGGEVFWVRVVL